MAGPRVLEHMVDTVLYFEGDRHASYRILRAVKNRFGSTNEIGVFEMRQNGLVEVENPSEYMLSGKPEECIRFSCSLFDGGNTTNPSGDSGTSCQNEFWYAKKNSSRNRL